MPQAGIDENSVKTLLGYNPTTGLSEPLQVATASGRLLLDITVVSSTTPGTIQEIRDENYVPGMIGVEDDDGTITPLIIDSRNGYLFVDVLQE